MAVHRLGHPTYYSRNTSAGGSDGNILARGLDLPSEMKDGEKGAFVRVPRAVTGGLSRLTQIAHDVWKSCGGLRELQSKLTREETGASMRGAKVCGALSWRPGLCERVRVGALPNVDSGMCVCRLGWSLRDGETTICDS
jgi:hypothetical protein